MESIFENFRANVRKFAEIVGKNYKLFFENFGQAMLKKFFRKFSGVLSKCCYIFSNNVGKM